MVTSSLISSTSFMLGSALSLVRLLDIQLLHHAQSIDAIAARIFQPVHQVAHEVQPHAAQAVLRCQIRRRGKEWIERPAVVLDDDIDLSGSQLESHEDVVTVGVRVSVGDDVIEYLVKRYVEGDHDLVRETVLGAEAVDQL